ncbi:ABC-2 family transporter protein [Kribbella sp. NPDC051770]|uniref:ABC-2 family transporter protein n=1 Tax=Kribbella sp. NPDC051770 TaxID=3155413 RepID=UPI003413A439
MTRTAVLLGMGFWRSSVEWWSFRSFVLTMVAGQVVTPLLGLLIWSAAVPGDGSIETYYVVLLAVQLMTVSYEHHTLAGSIYGGDFAVELVKPRPVVLDFLGTNLALRFWHLAFGAPVIIGVGVLAGISLSGRDLLLALPAIVLAAGLRFAFTYTLALTAVWTQRAHGAVGMGEALIFLLGGTAAPLTFLPEPFRAAGAVLPFWSMLGAPAEVAAGNVDDVLRVYAVQAGWFAAAVLLAVLVWRRAVRRFTAFGG